MFKQEVSFWQQKSSRKGSKRYLTFGPHHILITLRCDDGRSSGHKNVCRCFLNRCKYFVGPSKLRNRVFLEKCSKWNLNFQNWSKALCLGVSEPTKRLAARSKPVKFLKYMMNFFPTNDFSLLESCQLYIIEKYKATNC